MTLAGSSPSSEGDLVSRPWDKIVAVEQIEETLVSGFSCGDEAMEIGF